ncbi:hypothetical protein M0Q28_00965 [Patescibacteria group bacterium]|jgi:hypothetical protein|nr:hypothetical protein [Patescibacteria group bacterium]
MDKSTSQASKSPLILLLCAQFSTHEARLAFENLLRTARVVIEEATYRFLDPRNRAPAYIHTWLREQTRHWDGPLVLFFAANGDDPLQAASKIGTLDQFIPHVRVARKVLLLDQGQLDPPHAIQGYTSFDGEGRPAQKPLFLMRLGDSYEFETARALGNFLGTRDRPRAPTETLLAVRGEEPGVPSRPERGDQTLQAFALEDPKTGQMRAVPARRDSAVIEAVRLGSGRPDPRADPEDDRETIPPLPGVGPADVPSRVREDPTQPK